MLAAVTVTEDVPLLVVSAWLIALTSTDAGLGTEAGAVYIPVLEIVPTVALPPDTLLTCQVTAALVVLLTAAVNCCCFPLTTVAVEGLTDTATWGGGGDWGVELLLPPLQPSIKTATAKQGIRRLRSLLFIELPPI